MKACPCQTYKDKEWNKSKRIRSQLPHNKSKCRLEQEKKYKTD